jgi:predicted nucleic acid-binding protein
MIVVDASVWVSALTRFDVHHAASRDWYQRRIASGLSILAPTLLFVEVAGAISRLTGSPLEGYRAVRLIRRTPDLDLVPLDTKLSLRAVQCAADLGLRGADAAYVGLALDEKVPLITWDTEQQARASRYVTVCTPLTYPW